MDGRPECGTDAGYQYHKRYGEPTEDCGCAQAHRDYNNAAARVRRAQKAFMRSMHRQEFEELKRAYLREEKPGWGGYSYVQVAKAANKALNALVDKYREELP